VRHVAIRIVVSIALLFCAAAAAAQASRVGATFEGTVRDTSGAVIPNSKVTLHNPLTIISTVTTTSRASFEQSSLLSALMKCEWNSRASPPYRQAALERVSDKPFISTSFWLRRRRLNK